MNSPNPTQASSKPPPRHKHDKTIFRTILVLFLSACVITITSHHLVNNDLRQQADKGESALLSVPRPRIREPAKGGLPPIPDFVKKKTAGIIFISSLCIFTSIYLCRLKPICSTFRFFVMYRASPKGSRSEGRGSEIGAKRSTSRIGERERG